MAMCACLWDINLAVAAGEITCIVGSNGAGKTTLLRTISGLVPATSGRIRFAGEDIDVARVPTEILGRGIAHVPEGRRLFRGLNVRDNLLLGAYLRRDDAADPDAILITSSRCSRSCGAPAAGCHHAVRRRAADVRDRTRDHVAAEASDDRRVVAWARATAGRTAQRGAAQRSIAPASRSCWSSRT